MYFDEEICNIKSVFDLDSIKKDCEYLRKEPAPNGVYLCALSHLKVEKSNYGRLTFKCEFRNEENKVLNKNIVLEGDGVENTIRFLHSFRLMKDISYDTIINDLSVFEKNAKLFKYRIAYVEFDAIILGRELNVSL